MPHSKEIKSREKLLMSMSIIIIRIQILLTAVYYFFLQNEFQIYYFIMSFILKLNYHFIRLFKFVSNSINFKNLKTQRQNI